jgi:regulator of protease activity HflC (stomatin/prohibitin superfamily)
LHWIIPFAERVEKYPISRQSYTMSSTAGEGQILGDDSVKARTKDGQEIFIDASVIYSIDPVKVVDLQRTWQNRYEDAIVRPLARGIVRDMASQYGVEEIVSSKRVEMELLITDELTKKFAENNLILVDFLVRNVAFSEQYALAVEQKQIAEQQAQQAQLVVEQKRQEAEQARQVAQGQADAAVIAAKGAAESRLIQADAEAKAAALIAAALKETRFDPVHHAKAGRQRAGDAGSVEQPLPVQPAAARGSRPGQPPRRQRSRGRRRHSNLTTAANQDQNVKRETTTSRLTFFV